VSHPIPASHDPSDEAGADEASALGKYLKQVRGTLGLTLRGVESATSRAVTNGYLSQIESGTIQQPSPRVLHHLAEVYGIDYGDLLERAGHRVPVPAGAAREATLNGFPLRALDDLTPDETSALMEYLEFLKSRR
jgi:transcriptional regulator with XRE-family HTH domain